MTINEQRLNLEQRRQVNLAREQEWIRGRMAGDRTFDTLTTPQQEYAHLGRTYVVWKLQDGLPVIRCLLKVISFALSGAQGLCMTLQVSEPTCPLYEFNVSHQPKRLGMLPLYLWIPAYCDLRYTPMNPHNPKGHCLLSTTFVARTEGRYKLRADEGKTYLSALKEFNEFWPAFAI